jgi:hypothetical protein
MKYLFLSLIKARYKPKNLWLDGEWNPGPLYGLPTELPRPIYILGPFTTAVNILVRNRGKGLVEHLLDPAMCFCEV